MGHKQKSVNTGGFYDEHSNPLEPQTVSQFCSEINEILTTYLASFHRRGSLYSHLP